MEIDTFRQHGCDVLYALVIDHWLSVLKAAETIDKMGSAKGLNNKDAKKRAEEMLQIVDLLRKSHQEILKAKHSFWAAVTSNNAAHTSTSNVVLPSGSQKILTAIVGFVHQLDEKVAEPLRKAIATDQQSKQRDRIVEATESYMKLIADVTKWRKSQPINNMLVGGGGVRGPGEPGPRHIGRDVGVVVALIALIGVVVTAYANYKAQVDIRKLQIEAERNVLIATLNTRYLELKEFPEVVLNTNVPNYSNVVSQRIGILSNHVNGSGNGSTNHGLWQDALSRYQQTFGDRTNEAACDAAILAIQNVRDLVQNRSYVVSGYSNPVNALSNYMARVKK